MSQVVTTLDHPSCRLCGRTEADEHLIAVHLVNVFPVRKYFVCQQCLHEIEARHRRAKAG
jgi:hypothetical protein